LLLSTRSHLVERFVHPTSSNVARVEVELVELADCECVLVVGVVVDPLHLRVGPIIGLGVTKDQGLLVRCLGSSGGATLVEATHIAPKGQMRLDGLVEEGAGH